MRSKSRREVLRIARKNIAEVAPLWHRQGLLEDAPRVEIRRAALRRIEREIRAEREAA